ESRLRRGQRTCVMMIEPLDDEMRRPERTQPATAFNRNSDDGWKPTSIAKRETRCSPGKFTSRLFGCACCQGSAPNLVSRPPHHPQLLSKSYRGCTGPCSETF